MLDYLLWWNWEAHFVMLDEVICLGKIFARSLTVDWRNVIKLTPDCLASFCDLFACFPPCNAIISQNPNNTIEKRHLNRFVHERDNLVHVKKI